MKIDKVAVRRDGKMVHGIRTHGNTLDFTLCGCEIYKRNETHSIHDYDVRFVINCKRCKAVMRKMRQEESTRQGIMPLYHDKMAEFRKEEVKKMRNIGTGIVHALKHPGAMYSICHCGHEIGAENAVNYERVLRSDARVTCERCLAALGEPLGPTFDPGVSPVITPGKSQDVYYEVKLKDGSYETITDVESAQEAAVECGNLFGTALDEIECIHRIRLEEVIFPSVNIRFEE
jgi:hypothetical protein